MNHSTRHKHGALIGKYRILGELGAGGMGVVYLAEDTSLGRQVALKSIRGALAEDESLLRRFEAEARAVGKLFHPHIVPINALIREGGALYIEMPFLQGGSLETLMEARGLRRPEAVLYCAEILDALAACHEKGMVHRDVKPSNILLDGHGRALLGDFGLAKVVGEEMSSLLAKGTASSFFVGTPRYAPLEAWDESPPTPAWDLYSVGVILFEVIAGRPIYESHSLLAHMRAMEQHPAPTLSQVCPDVSPALSGLVASLLENNVENRLADARDARNTLMRTPEYKRLEYSVVDTMTLVQRSPRLYIKKLRSKAKPRYLRWTAAVATLAIAAALFGHAMRPAPSGDENSRRPSQDSIWALPHYVAEGVLGATRFGEARNPRVLVEVSACADHQPVEKWLALTLRGGGAQQVLAHTDGRLARLTLTPAGAGHVAIDGVWAHYLSSIAGEFAGGNVSGTGRWFGASRNLLVNLHYTAARQGLRWEESLALETVEETDTRFLWELEETPLLLRVIAEEMQRDSPAWSDLIPAWLPAVQSSFVVAGALADTHSIAIDGNLEDWAWHVNTTEGAPGWPAAIRPVLHAAFDATGIYIALEADAALSGAELEITLRRVMPGAPDPALDRHFMRSPGGQHRVEGRGDAPLATRNVSWRAAAESAETGWRGEIHIPFTDADTPVESPQGRYYRVNIRVRETVPDAANALEAIWGAPDQADPSHGVLIHLPARRSGDPAP